MNDQNDQIVNQDKKCLKCKYFQERTGFCRFNPPQIVLKENGYYMTCFPKIAMPNLDYCFKYEENLISTLNS